MGRSIRFHPWPCWLAKPRRDGMKSVRPCGEQLLWIRGKRGTAAGYFKLNRTGKDRLIRLLAISGEGAGTATSA